MENPSRTPEPSPPLNPDRVAVLIPAYQEERHIREVAARARAVIPAVLVIDDGSGDATAREAAEAGAEVIRHPRNQGKGAAIKTGFRTLLARGFEYVIILDGDGQHLPEEIGRFLETAAACPGLPFLIGSRMRESARMPLLRRWTNRLLSRGISRLCGVPVPDTQCGFRMVHRSLIPALFCESNAFEYETEMILIAGRRGCPIRSVAISTIYADEVSRIRPLRDGWRILRLLARYRKSPLR